MRKAFEYPQLSAFTEGPLRHFGVDVAEHRSSGVDREVRLRISEEGFVRMRKAGVVHDGVQRVERGAHRHDHAAGFVTERDRLFEPRMVLAQDLEQDRYRRVALGDGYALRNAESEGDHAVRYGPDRPRWTVAPPG